SNIVRIIFNTDIFRIPITGKNHFNIYNANTLIFYSENGTTFDFRNSVQSSFTFHLNTNQVNVVFQNITFTNFGNYELKSIEMFFLNFKDYSDNYTIEFDNCIFKDSIGTILQSNIKCTKHIQTTPQLIFNKCKFSALDQILEVVHEKDDSFKKSYECFSILFKDCFFENLKFIGEVDFANLEFNN
ncbi:hypothetical protein BCR36DRAFT_235212, partial [Piromyces finnis]